MVKNPIGMRDINRTRCNSIGTNPILFSKIIFINSLIKNSKFLLSAVETLSLAKKFLKMDINMSHQSILVQQLSNK